MSSSGGSRRIPSAPWRAAVRYEDNPDIAPRSGGFRHIPRRIRSVRPWNPPAAQWSPACIASRSPSSADAYHSCPPTVPRPEGTVTPRPRPCNRSVRPWTGRHQVHHRSVLSVPGPCRLKRGMPSRLHAWLRVREGPSPNGTPGRCLVSRSITAWPSVYDGPLHGLAERLHDRNPLQADCGSGAAIRSQHL